MVGINNVITMMQQFAVTKCFSKPTGLHPVLSKFQNRRLRAVNEDFSISVTKSGVERRIWQSILLIAVSTIACSTLKAQDNLSLKDALRTGLLRNYDVQIENRNVRISENNNSWGEAGRMPAVTLNTNYNNSLVNNESGDQFFNGRIFPGFELNNQINGSLSPAINVNWVIFNGNKVNIAKTRLESLQQETQGNADIVVANTIQAIILAYYIAELENRRLTTLEDQLKLSGDKLKRAEARSELGIAVTSDVLLEEGNYLNDSVSYISQKLIRRNALRNLNFLLNEPDIDKDYRFTDNMEREAEPLEYAALAARLESENVDLKKAYLSQTVLGHNTRMAAADRLPRLSADLGYNYSRSVQDLRHATSTDTSFVAPNETSVNLRGTYYANFTLSFTLFNGNRINRAIKNAMIREDIGNIRIEKLQASLNRDLADAYDRYATRLAIYNINKRRVAATEVNLRLSKERYENGTIDSFDYRTVQTNARDARIRLLQSLYDLIDTKVALLRLAGGLLEFYGEG